MKSAASIMALCGDIFPIGVGAAAGGKAAAAAASSVT